MVKRLHNFDVLLNWYREHLTITGYRPRTIKSYTHELALFRRWLGEHTTVTEPADLNKEEITGFIAHLYTQNLAATTISHKTAVLKSFLTTLYRENRIYRDLSNCITIPRQPRKIPKGLLTESEINHLLDYLKQESETTPIGTYKSAADYRDRTMLELLYSTGIRKAELLSLRLESLDLGSAILYIRNGKGGKDRVVPVGSVALEVVEIYLNEARAILLTATSESFLFPSKKGGHISESTFGDTVHRLCKSAGITKRVRVHDFRHACATHMLNRGADIRFVQELLGHASLSSTQVYTHVAIDHLKRSHEQFHPRELWNR